MTPAAAIRLLHVLERAGTEQVALEPKDHVGTGLKAKKVLRDVETGELIFIYVDRLELIECIRRSHDLHKKGTPLCHILNLRGGPGPTQSPFHQ